MGPFVRMGFASLGERRPDCDETGALRAGLALAARDVETLSARAGAGAGECLEFQLALLEDETLVAPAFERIAEGGAADSIWRRVMDDLIREYAANPSEYVQTRGLDIADLRGGDVAADPEQTLKLLNCGLREFSMSANAPAAVKGALLESSEARLV